IVVYTGDYVSWENEEQLQQLEEVMAHAPLGSLGTVAVLGNHDYGQRWQEAEVADQITEVLEAAGVQVLRNSTQQVGGLHIIGIDEWLGTNFAPETALADYQPGAANLVLCHNPDVCDLPVWNGYEGWILAGHTHGGQCKPPFLAPPIMSVRNKRYTAGAFALGDGRNLYINRALGCSYPVRFNVRPEITVFELEEG
ncbi:MAG: phosphoesterase, partial [Bacteroidota bacterium]